MTIIRTSALNDSAADDCSIKHVSAITIIDISECVSKRDVNTPLLLSQRGSLQRSLSPTRPLTLPPPQIPQSTPPTSATTNCSRRSAVKLVCRFLLGVVAIVIFVAAFLILPRLREDVSLDVEYKLMFHTLQTAETTCLSQPRSPLIISLTTLPQRTAAMQRTLMTLMLQTRCPTAIWLWVPTHNERFGQTYAIPPELLAFNVTSAILRIFTIENDYGPATKFIPAVEKLSQAKQDDQGIVVLDDDILYSPHLLAYHECYNKIHPQSALTNWGCTMATIEAGDFGYDTSKSGTLQSRRWCYHGMHQEEGESYLVDIMLGTSSYYIQPNFFSPQVLARISNYNMSSLLATLPLSILSMLPPIQTLEKAALFEDDLWLSILLTLSHTPRLSVPMHPPHHRPFDTLFMTRGALSHSNNADEFNFRQLGMLISQLSHSSPQINYTHLNKKKWSDETSKMSKQTFTCNMQTGLPVSSVSSASLLSAK